MKVKQLKNIIKNLDDNTEVTVIDSDLNYFYNIIDIEIITIFDDTFLDIVVDMEE